MNIQSPDNGIAASDNMEPADKKRKKKDKAKEKYDRTGGFSSKHARISQGVKERKK